MARSNNYFFLILLSAAYLTDASSTKESCSDSVVKWQDEICCNRSCAKGWRKFPLLVVSLDGFRADYILRNKTPSIQRLFDCSSHAPFIYSTYPTKTFPNHYAMVTVWYKTLCYFAFGL